MYCSSFQCPHRSTPIKDACTTKCESDTCEASQCCEARCSYHQCPDRSAPIEDADTSVCADLACTDDLCCQALCSYHQCPSGEGLVVGGDDLVCPELECSNELCCGKQISGRIPTYRRGAEGGGVCSVLARANDLGGSNHDGAKPIGTLFELFDAPATGMASYARAQIRERLNVSCCPRSPDKGQLPYIFRYC